VTAAGEREEASVHRHRREAPGRVGCAVVTVSDTRTRETDSGGDLLVALLEGAGHAVARRVLVPDAVEEIRAGLRAALDDPRVRAVLLTGGTGVAPRDVTPEAVAPLVDRPLPGFGELFRMLSFQEIGSAALVSRALAGMCGGKAVFALPGSRAAIRLALERLVLPELGHLVGEGAKDGARQGRAPGGR
jgi:molybdenum cofactor biosynthesis protein B